MSSGNSAAASALKDVDAEPLALPVEITGPGDDAVLKPVRNSRRLKSPRPDQGSGVAEPSLEAEKVSWRGSEIAESGPVAKGGTSARPSAGLPAGPTVEQVVPEKRTRRRSSSGDGPGAIQQTAANSAGAGVEILSMGARTQDGDGNDDPGDPAVALEPGPRGKDQSRSRRRRALQEPLGGSPKPPVSSPSSLRSKADAASDGQPATDVVLGASGPGSGSNGSSPDVVERPAVRSVSSRRRGSSRQADPLPAPADQSAQTVRPGVGAETPDLGGLPGAADVSDEGAVLSSVGSQTEPVPVVPRLQAVRAKPRVTSGEPALPHPLAFRVTSGRGWAEQGKAVPIGCVARDGERFIAYALTEDGSYDVMGASESFPEALAMIPDAPSMTVTEKTGPIPKRLPAAKRKKVGKAEAPLAAV